MTDDKYMKEIMRMVEEPDSASVSPCDAINETILLWVCVEDLRRLPEELSSAAVKGAATVFHSLKRLEGKTIKRVVLDDSKNRNVTSHEFNPFGNRFSIKVVTQ